jgi:hypothetical protein
VQNAKGKGKGKGISPLANLVVASVAGVCNVLLTTPLWVVVHRIKSSRCNIEVS